MQEMGLPAASLIYILTLPPNLTFVLASKTRSRRYLHSNASTNIALPCMSSTHPTSPLQLACPWFTSTPPTQLLLSLHNQITSTLPTNFYISCIIGFTVKPPPMLPTQLLLPLHHRFTSMPPTDFCFPCVISFTARPPPTVVTSSTSMMHAPDAGTRAFGFSPWYVLYALYKLPT